MIVEKIAIKCRGIKEIMFEKEDDDLEIIIDISDNESGRTMFVCIPMDDFKKAIYKLAL